MYGIHMTDAVQANVTVPPNHISCTLQTSMIASEPIVLSDSECEDVFLDSLHTDDRFCIVFRLATTTPN